MDEKKLIYFPRFRIKIGFDLDNMEHAHIFISRSKMGRRTKSTDLIVFYRLSKVLCYKNAVLVWGCAKGGKNRCKIGDGPLAALIPRSEDVYNVLRSVPICLV